jgi:hypothetical protein
MIRRLRDDRGSMPLVILVSIVGMIMSGMLVPILLTQSHSTRFDSTRVQSIDAAQAGLDLALGKIRGATTAGAGDATDLPCGPINGSVDGTGAVAYTVTFNYYATDPTVTPAPAPMNCVSGYGTYDTSSGQVTPAWAQITSAGSAGGGNGASKGRTLVATYRLKTNNTNLPGGVIRIYSATSTSSLICIDAGSGAPAAGTAVKMQQCSTSTPPVDQQIFVYRTDLTLQLLPSVTASNSNGLCLTAPTTNGTPVAGAITLTACSVLGSPPWQQQWSFDDNGHLRASLSGSKTDGNLSGYCMDTSVRVNATLTASTDTVTFASAVSLSVGETIVFRNVTAGLSSGTDYTVKTVVDSTHVVLTSDINANGTASAAIPATAGQPITLDTCVGSIADPTQAWVPSPAVGAGAATNPQWVNYYEFGRCLDITGQNVNASYLIDYPCKQNPYPNAVAWNQKFTAPTIASGATSATGNFYTTTGGTNYCLTSPLTSGGLLVVKPCNASTAGQKWTVYNNDDSLTYTMKYTIVDSAGLCMSLTTLAAADPWSVIDVERCVGRRDQKWNADPTTPGIVNVQEK